MANTEKHSPGSFCWIELGTTDQKAAKDFYQKLFGWTPEDEPMGPGGFYTMFQLEGRHTGAAYSLTPEMREMKLPSHWMLYIAVENADGSAQKAATLGAELIKPPFDVFDAGRMAIIKDPTGAVFCIWEAKKSVGTRIAGIPGTLCWADLNTTDPSRAKDFYSELFGWELSPAENDSSGYLHIRNGEHFIGGVPPAGESTRETPSHWLIYISSADCDATCVAAKQMGARFHLPPLTMEGVGRMAVLSDPQGAVFAVFQAMRHN